MISTEKNEFLHQEKQTKANKAFKPNIQSFLYFLHLIESDGHLLIKDFLKSNEEVPFITQKSKFKNTIGK